MARLFFSDRYETGFRRGRAVVIAAAALAGTAAIAAPANAASASCAVVFDTGSHYVTGFTVPGRVVNTGTTAFTGWRISWTFTGDEKLFSLLTTKWTQTGQSVTAGNVSWNGTVNPGGAVTITAVGSSANGVFGVTGLTCTPL